MIQSPIGWEVETPCSLIFGGDPFHRKFRLNLNTRISRMCIFSKYLPKKSKMADAKTTTSYVLGPKFLGIIMSLSDLNKKSESCSNGGVQYVQTICSTGIDFWHKEI